MHCGKNTRQWWECDSLGDIAQWQWSLSATLHTLFWNGLRNMTKSLRCCPGLQIPQISIRVGFAGTTGLIFGDSVSHLTGLNGSVANILVPDTTGHLQWSCKVHALASLSCFGVTQKTHTSDFEAQLVLLNLSLNPYTHRNTLFLFPPW